MPQVKRGAWRELWVPVPMDGLEGRYQVSSLGRVRHVRFNEIRVLKPCETGKGGYLSIGMWDGIKLRRASLHRLVCTAFHGEPKDGLHAAHINGNPKDNRASNLVWATPTENAAHKVIHGRVPNGERHPNAKLTWERVREIRRRAGTRGEKTKMAAEFGLSKHTIWRVVTNKEWIE